MLNAIHKYSERLQDEEKVEMGESEEGRYSEESIGLDQLETPRRFIMTITATQDKKGQVLSINMIDTYEASIRE